MHSLLFVFFTQFSWLLSLHSIACCQDVKHVAEVYLCNHMNTDKNIECLQNDSQSNRSKPKFLYQHVLPEQLLFHHNLKAVFKKTHIIYFLSLSPSLCLSLPLFSLFMVLVSGVLIPASALSQLHPSSGGFRTKQICYPGRWRHMKEEEEEEEAGKCVYVHSGEGRGVILIANLTMTHECKSTFTLPPPILLHSWKVTASIHYERNVRLSALCFLAT